MLVDGDAETGDRGERGGGGARRMGVGGQWGHLVRGLVSEISRDQMLAYSSAFFTKCVYTIASGYH